MTEPRVLLEGKFDPKVKTYWLISPMVPMVLSIVLIPIVPIFFIIAWFVVDRWVAALRCTLTERTLIIRKGLINRVESTVPLEKITDLQIFQGPIMRAFGLRGFRVETAGQSSGPGGFLVNMVGIVDTPGFRKAVLEQSDLLSERRGSAGAAPREDGEAGDLRAIAGEIRDTLGRIEQRLAERG